VGLACHISSKSREGGGGSLLRREIVTFIAHFGRNQNWLTGYT
jgi:hypothetical protein